MGIYGIKVIKNISPGNIAKKNLKASEVALVFKEPFTNPLEKNSTTSCKGIPSNPGKTSLLDKAILLITKDVLRIFFLFFETFYFVAFKLRSKLLTEWVSVPHEIYCTPVKA